MSLTRLPLRLTLTAFIVSLIILISAAIFGISYTGSANSVLILSNSMTGEISKGIIGRVSSLLGDAEKVNSQIAFLMRSGFLQGDDATRSMDQAAELIANYESFTSVDIGFVNGNKFKAERMPDGSTSRRSYIRDEKAGKVTMTWFHANPAYAADFKDKKQDLKKGYDPRTRPWWTAAITAGRTTWTDMYVSGTRKQFVYSCATPIHDADGRLLGVSSIDINVVTLSEFLGTLSILSHGKAFIVNDRKQVIAVPMKQAADLDQLVRKSPEGSENPFEFYRLDELPDAAIRNAITSPLNASGDRGVRNFEYRASGSDYIATMVAFPYKPGTTFTIGIIVPKNDIMENIQRNSLIVIISILVFLVITLIVGIQVSRTLARSLTKLAREVDKVARLELDSKETVKTVIFEVQQIDDAVENMKRGLRSFRKYVPADLVLQLNTLQKEAVLEGEKRELSMFFSDIAGFTNISEQLSAEALVENLGVYFNGMSRTILENGGTLDKYIGDAIMAFWGAPVKRGNHAELACLSALKCQAWLDKLAAGWAGSGKPMFHTRIGIHTGEVIVGNIGYEERMNYTIIGDNVNLASRLEGLNKYYGTRIIVSDQTLAAAGGNFVTRKLDLVAVKGKSKGILIHELVGIRGEVDAERLALAERYNQGLQSYLGRDWEAAGQAFDEVSAANGPEDLASAMMAGRCRSLAGKTLPAYWDGVYQFDEK